MMKRLIALLLAAVMLFSCTAVLAERTLYYGLFGEDVVSVQNRLTKYEFYTGAISGNYDKATEAAVKAFQRANSLTADGKVGPLTLAKLNSETAISKSVAEAPFDTLSYGDTGDRVTAAQQKLAELGYFGYFADGIYGSTTMAAVKAFQRANGLTDDGKIGKKTNLKLFSGAAISASAAKTTSTLQAGSYGEDVKELQRQLHDAFYYVGKIDGLYGPDVVTAVKNFQQSVGLKADGKAGSATKNALYNRTAAIFNGGIPRRQLSSGSRGYDVYVLQMKLLDLNYLKMLPTGYYSTETVAAVKAFQEANGLKVDGKAGTLTRRYLWPTATSKAEDAADDAKRTADNPVTERTLRLKSSGNDVANLQMRLKAAGYLFDSADGVYGLSTEEAVKKLQKEYGLKIDGICGPDTWGIVKFLSTENAEQQVVDPTKRSTGAQTYKLRQGNHGTQVKKLQQQLIELGYMTAGQDDGRFGPITTAAVKAFQKDMTLVTDGIVGTKTIGAINEALGIQYDVEN